VVVVVLCDCGAIAGSCEVVVVVVWLCAIALSERAAAKAAPARIVPIFLNAIVFSCFRNRGELRIQSNNCDAALIFDDV
jgi:hypothetical protein